ncbi:hypothetical protein KUTeg_008668 [Tegillarca granosa]|uniref:Sulfotransferase domain-containing protein n=1 Tax=Tegillarca granosa TaxID=220873 RepID=A0ABQ9F9T7_TEGGR|nr:hypothetical protein KUTeg_008668 [Tegillarca granosa]
MVPKHKLVEKLSPRMYTSDMPLHFLPRQFAKKGRIICVFRNLKDLEVSFYHVIQKITFAEFDGSFDEFLKLFYNGDRSKRECGENS